MKLIVLLMIFRRGNMEIGPQHFSPRTNVWVSLAKRINQTNFCVSLAQPESPFHTCLIGVPLNDSEAIALMRDIKGKLKQNKCNGTMTNCTIMTFGTMPYHMVRHLRN